MNYLEGRRLENIKKIYRVSQKKVGFVLWSVSPSNYTQICWVNTSFERWDLKLCLKYKNISVPYQGAKVYKQKDMGYKISRICNNEQYNI